MKNNFNRVMDGLIFPNEGGYVDNPKDPGGATNLGVTQATLAAWRKRPVSKAEVKALGKPEARDIYRKAYADKVAFDELPSGLDAAVLDYAVNSGPSRAVKALQGLVGAAQDGIIGPKTLAAVARYGAGTLVTRLCDERMRFLRGLKTWKTFGKGWTSRVVRVRSFAQAIAATGAVQALMTSQVEPAPDDGPNPVALVAGMDKAPPSDTAVTKTSIGASAAVALAGAAVAGLAGTVQALTDALAPYAGSAPWVDRTLAVLAVAGALVAGVGSFATLAAKARSLADGSAS